MTLILNKPIIFNNGSYNDRQEHKDVVLTRKMQHIPDFTPGNNLGIKFGELYDHIAFVYYDIIEDEWIVNLKTSEFNMVNYKDAEKLVSQYIAHNFEIKEQI